MSYPPRRHAGPGQASARLRRADAPPDLRYASGVEVHHLAIGSQTRGDFGLYRWDFSPARTGPEPHFHRTISESFFVLAGTITFYDGKAWIEAIAGDYLFVPEGGVHGFRNESGAVASMLLHFSPGAPREEYFERLAHLPEQPFREGEREAFMTRHDTYWV